MGILKVCKNQGYQAIPDVRKAVLNPMFRGLPIIKNCPRFNDCGRCAEVCPAGAISSNPLSIDLGKCVLCGDCSRVCPDKAIIFSNHHKLSTDERKNLIVTSETTLESYLDNAIKIRSEITRVFGKSLKLRQVSAAGCNGCELELNACGNVNFDMGRFGIEFVASPRHADGIVITGPVSENMAAALHDTYMCMPEPRLIILCGACAISGGVFAGSKALNREFLKNHKIDLYIPGCPPHPLTVINGLLNLCGR